MDIHDVLPTVFSFCQLINSGTMFDRLLTTNM